MNALAVTFIEPNGSERTIGDLQPGESLMSIAKGSGIDGITADCGGGCSCATCHVVIDPRWWDQVGPPDDVEEAMLDMVSEVRETNSRLSCQISLTPELDGIRVSVVPAF